MGSNSEAISREAARARVGYRAAAMARSDQRDRKRQLHERRRQVVGLDELGHLVGTGAGRLRTQAAISQPSRPAVSTASAA